MNALVPAITLNSIFLTLLLACAGRWNYWPAWVYAATGLVMSVLTRLVLRHNPELLDERRKPKLDAKNWDKKLLGLGFLLTIAMLIAAGLDARRSHVNSVLSWPASIIGLSLNLVGMGIFSWSLRENRFFSSVVRIQTDRGHAVCDTGPYSLVRHPGYAGMIVGTIGLPLLFMSVWSAVPALLFVLITVVRTGLEDRVLQAELSGYREYCETTRYRLVPGIW